MEGLLLYPLVDAPIESLKGQWIRVRTINLATSWSDIRAQLLELLRAVPASISGQADVSVASDQLRHEANGVVTTVSQ